LAALIGKLKASRAHFKNNILNRLFEMENTTIPYVDTGGCNLQNICVAVTSLAVALGLITCCYCCGIGIRLINAKNKRQATLFATQDPVTVVVHNKLVIATTSTPDEDPC